MPGEPAQRAVAVATQRAAAARHKPAAARGSGVDCLFDEAVIPTPDTKGNFTVVVTRAPGPAKFTVART